MGLLRGADELDIFRDRRAIGENIETEPKIRKWFPDLTRLSTYGLQPKKAVHGNFLYSERINPVLFRRLFRRPGKFRQMMFPPLGPTGGTVTAGFFASGNQNDSGLAGRA